MTNLKKTAVSPITEGTGRAIPPESARPSEDEIATLAYELWQARGCPEGSSQVDWMRAVEQLSPASAAAA